MRTLILRIALGALALATGCGENKSPGSAVTNAAPAPTVSVPNKAPTVATADSTSVITGPIIVEHQLDLTAQRDGVVAKILLDAPARVKAGTLLAQMDDRQLISNLEGARAKSRSIANDLKNWESEAEVLKADYARQQKMFDMGLTSEEQLQHAKFKAESDQWDIKRVMETLNTAHEEERSIELELEKTKIVAPFDGLIARRYVREGQSVGKGDRLFWVTAEAPLLLRFTLPEKYFGKIHPAQQFEVSCMSAPGEKHFARVKEISPVLDPSSGTFEVLAEFVGDHGSFRPGMTATLHLDSH